MAAFAATRPAYSIAVLRVSDGSVLESSGDCDAWVNPPGSTVKPFVISELLRAGKLKPRETFLCTGKYSIADRNFTCSHPSGLPPFDAARVLAYSCNGGVAHFAARFGAGELAAALERAGFRVGAGDPVLQALGEQGVLATPLRLARAYRKLAVEQNPVIVAGLEGAVQYGTAQAAALEEVSVAGKTGSATGSNGLHAAWFAGFAPSRAPAFVLAIGMQGRSGGSDAAPVASQTFRRCFAGAGEHYRVRTGGTVVTVRVEEYVAGVVAGESATLQQTEALRAMALAARTYAAHERGRHRSEGFDFCDTTHCQRFEPSGISERVRAAAEATRGEMIRFGGRLAFTPYTMGCGGMSEAADAVWPDVPAPYLAVRADPFCTVKRWGCHLAAADVAHALSAAGLECPAGLRLMRVTRRTASGRAASLLLVGDRSIETDAGAFRFAIGRTLAWNLVRSNWFDISGGFELSGRGEGHGVGLCQRGAESMAGKGHSYREIIAFYYPGVTTLNWVKLGGETVTVYGTDRNRDVTVLSEAERLIPKLPWPPRTAPVIYVYPDVDAFRSETREPGWVAAHTEGGRIDLQPIAVLQQRNAFTETLHHELLHVVIEQHAAREIGRASCRERV